MAVAFTCPHCNKTMQVDDTYAGQSGPCAGCGKTITIPGPAKPFASAGTAPPKPGLPPMPGPAGYGSQVTGGQGTGGQGFGDIGFAPPPRSSGMASVLVAVGIIAVIALLFCGGILVALLVPAVQKGREAARRAQSVNNMKQIVIAFHNYHSQHRAFPPAFVTDASGKPLYSWRVLILPYLGDPASMAASQQFDLSKAWDSPENIAASSITIPVFQSPNDEPGCCSYMALTGPNTMFPGEKGTSMRQIVDGSSNTIAIVEVLGRQQSWAEPKDVDVSTLPAIVGPGPGQVPGKPAAGFNAGLADGSIRYFPVAPQMEAEVRAMSTINGGEGVGGRATGPAMAVPVNAPSSAPVVVDAPAASE